MDTVRRLTRQGTNLPLAVLLYRLNPVLRGWATYFRPGVSSATFRYLSSFGWRRVLGWLWRKHGKPPAMVLRRRYCGGGWWPRTEGVTLFNPAKVRTTRYRFRGAAIPSPWASVAT
jgi:RNA-directed DNA polymerase